jgi:hypothetical protein
MHVKKRRPVVENRSTDSVHRCEWVKELKRREYERSFKGKDIAGRDACALFVLVVVVGALERKLLASRSS